MSARKTGWLPADHSGLVSSDCSDGVICCHCSFRCGIRSAAARQTFGDALPALNQVVKKLVVATSVLWLDLHVFDELGKFVIVLNLFGNVVKDLIGVCYRGSESQ